MLENRPSYSLPSSVLLLASSLAILRWSRVVFVGKWELFSGAMFLFLGAFFAFEGTVGFVIRTDLWNLRFDLIVQKHIQQ